MDSKHACGYGVDPNYLPSVHLWEVAQEVIPPWPSKPKGGRPPMSDKKAFHAIFYILRTGLQWKALPRCLGAASTVHDRFQKWQKAGVFKKLWHLSLIEYDRRIGIDWEWQSIDSALTKAPFGQEKTGPNPTDRAKMGTKRHLLTEGKGVPIALVVTGAQRHDVTQVEAVLNNIIVERPRPTQDKKQHFCGDKAYDAEQIRELVAFLGYIEHIKSRREERDAKEQIPNYRARRWVNERAQSWVNRYRRLLIRWEKKADNYEALLHLACANITLRAIEVFG